LDLSGWFSNLRALATSNANFVSLISLCCVWAFYAQMVWVWLVSLPVTFLATTTVDPEFGTAADIAGIIMFIVGLVCEAVADQQKFSFKQNSANRGKWCDVGIWKYSRHPNYFGEILLWFGLFTIASSVFQPASDAGEGKWGYVTILGPLFITGILLFVSGIPLLETKADEKHGSKPEYREYKACTSVLIPFVPGNNC
jgi:steroid 5-alpha reductase family enzyme